MVTIVPSITGTYKSFAIQFADENNTAIGSTGISDAVGQCSIIDTKGDPCIFLINNVIGSFFIQVE